MPAASRAVSVENQTLDTPKEQPMKNRSSVEERTHEPYSNQPHVISSEEEIVGADEDNNFPYCGAD
jgi:hypothetical protein